MKKLERGNFQFGTHGSYFVPADKRRFVELRLNDADVAPDGEPSITLRLLKSIYDDRGKDQRLSLASATVLRDALTEALAFYAEKPSE